MKKKCPACGGSGLGDYPYPCDRCQDGYITVPDPPRVDFDALENAGHELTHLGMVMAGTSLYYCENCGSLLMIRGEEILFFHVHRGSTSEKDSCSNGTGASKTLKNKLDELVAADMAELAER
jgi:hypothetical protein